MLDALKIPKADVLGFSLGSLIAQELTIIHPEKVNKLVLYGSSCGGKDSVPSSPTGSKFAQGIIRNTTFAENRFKALVSLNFPQEWIKSHPNYLASIPQSKEIVSETTNLEKMFTTLKLQLLALTKWGTAPLSGSCDRIALLSKPTLIIVGTEDTQVPPGNSLILAGKIPGSWLVQMKGGGHGVMFQYPDKFSNIVKTFLEVA